MPTTRQSSGDHSRSAGLGGKQLDSGRLPGVHAAPRSSFPPSVFAHGQKKHKERPSDQARELGVPPLLFLKQV